jgi:hypothetical protein
MITNGFGWVKEFWESVKWVLFAIAGLLLFAYWMQEVDREQYRLNKQRQEVVCPSFLSIARSSRDTLIVMRNEPLCNSYVLDNLQ